MKKWMWCLWMCGWLLGGQVDAAPWNTAGWTREQLQQRLAEQVKGQEAIRTALRRLQDEITLRQGNGAPADEIQSLTQQLNGLRTADIQAQRYMSYLRQQLAAQAGAAAQPAGGSAPAVALQEKPQQATSGMVDLNKYRICDLCSKGRGVKRTSGQWLCDNCQHELDSMRNVAQEDLNKYRICDLCRKGHGVKRTSGEWLCDNCQATLDDMRKTARNDANESRLPAQASRGQKLGGDGGRVKANQPGNKKSVVNADVDTDGGRNRYVTDRDRNVDEELARNQQRLLDGDRNVAEEMARNRRNVIDGNRNVAEEMALARNRQRVIDGDRNVAEEIARTRNRYIADGDRNVAEEMALTRGRLQADVDRGGVEAADALADTGEKARLVRDEKEESYGPDRAMSEDKRSAAPVAYPPGVSVHTPPPGVQAPPTTVPPVSAAVHTPPPRPAPPDVLSAQETITGQASMVADDLRSMETPLAALAEGAPLSTSVLRNVVAAREEQTTARVNAAHGLIALNTAKDRVVEETDNKIREAENQKQQAYQTAIKTVQDATHARANDQASNSWATTVGDSLIVNGLTEGGKNFGSTFGTAAAVRVGRQLFPPKPAASGTSTSSGSTGSSGASTGGSGATSHGGDDGCGSSSGSSGGSSGGSSSGGTSSGGGTDVVNTQNNNDGTITVTYSCGNTWTGKPPAPANCPKCNQGTVTSTTGVDPTNGASDLTKRYVPNNVRGATSSDRGMVNCPYCGKIYRCGACANTNPNILAKHLHMCPECDRKGVSASDGRLTSVDGFIDAFCPRHKIKYGGRIRDKPKCPMCEREQDGLIDAYCPKHKMAYGGRIRDKPECPMCKREKDGLIDAYCPIHKIKYGGRIRDNPQCPQCQRAPWRTPGMR